MVWRRICNNIGGYRDCDVAGDGSQSVGAVAMLRRTAASTRLQLQDCRYWLL